MLNKTEKIKDLNIRKFTDTKKYAMPEGKNHATGPFFSLPALLFPGCLHMVSDKYCEEN